MSDKYKELLEGLTNSFLGWKLPDDFMPDGGISFEAPVSEFSWPVGTNLLTHAQAVSMFDYLLRGANPALDETSKEIESLQAQVAELKESLAIIASEELALGIHSVRNLARNALTQTTEQSTEEGGA